MRLSDFRQDFSGSAFKIIDGERRIVGKFCEIEILADDIWDVYLVRPDRASISTQKLTHLLRSIEALPEYERAGRPPITRLDGEAHLQTTDRGLILRVAFYAGVKRKRQVSEATRKASAVHLAKYRECAA